MRLSATGAGAEDAVRECTDRLQDLDRIFDADDPAAPLAKLRASAGDGEWIKLPPELWHVLSVSQLYSERTEGAWDVTIAPLSSLWRKALAEGAPPAPEEIHRARGKTNWRNLELRESDKSARLTEPGMGLDLGGVRKGLALDECRRIFEAHHVQGLIDFGESSIAVVGGKADGAPFRIALRHPRQEAPARLGVLGLKDSALSVSGDYEHYFLWEGVRYHHILDPHTGHPAQSGVTSVSVLVPGAEPDAGLTADILSTALFVTGPERGLALLDALPLRAEAAFSDEREIIACSHGWTEQLKGSPSP